jgi:hypothetical protein
MTVPVASSHARRASFAIAGPALVGAALGLHAGPAELLARAATLPAIVVGVALLMLPALYIGAAFLGVAPRAGAVARSGVAALADTGVVMLGLAPSLLFLVAASTSAAAVSALALIVLALAVAIGLRALFARLFERRGAAAIGLFACWSLVSAGIGAQLVARAVPLGWGG